MTNNKIENLQAVLANSYTLMIKTQNYHWNVTGKNFLSLHELFELQYKDLFAAIDEIAERIRALGTKPYGSLSKYSSLTSIKDGNENLNAADMLKDLINDQKNLVKLLKEVINIFEGDDVTIDMIISRIKTHEKNIWMMQSIVE